MKYPKLKVIMITAYGDEQNYNLAKIWERMIILQNLWNLMN